MSERSRPLAMGSGGELAKAARRKGEEGEKEEEVCDREDERAGVCISSYKGEAEGKAEQAFLCVRVCMRVCVVKRRSTEKEERKRRGGSPHLFPLSPSLSLSSPIPILCWSSFCAERGRSVANLTVGEKRGDQIPTPTEKD